MPKFLLGYADDQPVAFAVFFHNFSTFLGRPGLYLEDLFVIPEMRGRDTVAPCWLNWRGLRASGSAGGLNGRVLDWNEPAIEFYKNLGAVPMDEWTIFRVTGDRSTAWRTRCKDC